MRTVTFFFEGRKLYTALCLGHARIDADLLQTTINYFHIISSISIKNTDANKWAEN